jgi:predicted Zn-dependent protease
MTNPRIETFRAMLAKKPDNVLAHFGLANECMKEGLHAEAREHYEAYLAGYDDEGNGWSRYAEVLAELGETARSREALEKGIAAAHRFGHPGLVQELEERLEELDD